jgi:hypothetical protein
MTVLVGAAAGSLFVFKGKFRAVLINYPIRIERWAEDGGRRTVTRRRMTGDSNRGSVISRQITEGGGQ